MPSVITYRKGDIIQSNVEASSSSGKVVANESGNILTLSDQLTGVELSDNALQHLVNDGREDSFIIILSEGSVNLRKGFDSWSRQDTAGDINHLEVLGSSEGCNVARLCADIVVDGSLEPRNLEMSSWMKKSA